MIIGGYVYTKIFHVASLATGNQTVLMEQRYGDANHLNAYYSISISGIAGPTVISNTGGFNVINSIEIYGIK